MAHEITKTLVSRTRVTRGVATVAALGAGLLVFTATPALAADWTYRGPAYATFEGQQQNYDHDVEVMREKCYWQDWRFVSAGTDYEVRKDLGGGIIMLQFPFAWVKCVPKRG